ncbi:hypothetical protein FGM00_00590 [Aggregatimonas sangjinii]|uniref:Uncharacterized protein n=1 Tax=Aggregatimonas sangjinii TaxID=2583587 RepID=A0A5B7SKX3_9FLAO|nr:hypothetical protein [Aggregatimonas sangjinii]QCW98691.1 hypothetical protein FGM00_00590 [Aggregatimonas sangjinii]
MEIIFNPMGFLEHTAIWVKGEVLHGKVMTLLGMVLLLCCFFIWRNGNELLKGMLIPILLVVLITVGFGTMLMTTRPKHLQKLVIASRTNQREVFEKERARAFKNQNAYSKYYIAWAIVLMGGLIFFFLTNRLYCKGLALGILFLAISALIIDTLMHERSKTYYHAIETMN